MNTRRLAWLGLLVALGTAGGSVFHIPFYGSQMAPTQSTVNIVAAVLLGPWEAVAVAFADALLRDFVLHTGSILAFPGGMIGALLAGYLYRWTGRVSAACTGEIIGTGVLAALMAAPILKWMTGKTLTALPFVIGFGASAVAGAILAVVVVAALRAAGYADVREVTARGL